MSGVKHLPAVLAVFLAAIMIPGMVLSAEAVKKSLFDCKPGDVSIAENLKCVGQGPHGLWVNKDTLKPELCKLGDTYSGGPEKFYVCKGRPGSTQWVPDRSKRAAVEKRNGVDFTSWTSKHLVRKNETYEDGKPVIYESSLPRPYEILEMYENYHMDTTSDTTIIVVDDVGDIIIAGYGRKIVSQKKPGPQAAPEAEE